MKEALHPAGMQRTKGRKLLQVIGMSDEESLLPRKCQNSTLENASPSLVHNDNL